MHVVSTVPTRVARALAHALAPAMLLLACLAASAPGASSTVTVTFDLSSATWIDASGCASFTPDVTTLTLQAGSMGRTGTDCSVGFGSTNDTSMLHAFQTDGYGTAMADTRFSSQAGAPSTMNDIAPLGGGRAWAVGNTRAVLTTSNSGQAWAPPVNGVPGSFGNLSSVHASSPTNVWVAGNNGKVARTLDGGATAWTDLSGNLAAGVTDLDAIERIGSTIWIGGHDGFISRSVDDGASWTTQTSCMPGLGNHVWDLEFHDASRGWLGVDDGTVCVTTDGGATWALPAGVTGMAGSRVKGVEVVDATTVWIAGFDGRVSRTTDGGATWTPSTIPGATHLFDIHAADSRTAWVAGGGAKVHRTSDGGATWVDVSPAAAATTYYGMGGIGPEVWVGGNSTTILHSPTSSIADYDDVGNVDWTTPGAEAFGICLSSVAGGATTDGSTWTPLAGCAQTDGAHWRALPATSGPTAKVAMNTTVGSMTGIARMRFGARIAPTTAPGTYLAGVTFQTIAPTV